MIYCIIMYIMITFIMHYTQSAFQILLYLKFNLKIINILQSYANEHIYNKNCCRLNTLFSIQSAVPTSYRNVSRKLNAELCVWFYHFG